MRKTKIQKAAMVVAFAAAVTVVQIPGENPYQAPAVYAAVTESQQITKVVPTMTIAKRSATTAELKIAKVSGATSYRIYRSTKSTSGYTLVGTTAKTTYTDEGLTSTKAYYYKVKAVSSRDSSKYSNVVKLNATLSKTKNLKTSSGTNGVSLQWSSVDNASKYKVYRATSQAGTYEYIGSSKTSSYVDTTAVSGKTYYYKVRATRTVSGTVYNGVYSDKVSGTYRKSVSQNKPVNSPSVGGSNQTGSSGSTANTTAEYAAEVLRLINVERAKEGLGALTTTTKLGDAAYQRAIEIKSVFSHDRPDGSSCFTVLADFGVSYMAAGENIAYGQKTPEAVVQAWMNSSGHRANIMNGNFGKVGIGCYYNNGTYYWTQVFTD